MDLRHVSGLARPIQPGYPTNRWIALSTLAVLVVGWVWRGLAGAGWLAAGGWAALAAIAFFLAWALARELDPDRERAAFAAAGLMLPALVAAGAGWIALPDLAALFLVLLAARILNRTSGHSATVADGAVVLGLGLWLAVTEQPVYFAAGAIALLLDGVLLPPRNPRRLMTAAAAIAAVIAVVVIGQALWTQALSLPAILAAIAVGLPYAASVRAAGDIGGTADTGEQLLPARVRAGQMLALTTGLAAVIWDGAALVALLPLWAAMAAVAASRLLPSRSLRQG
jgi:hypothetical protein